MGGSFGAAFPWFFDACGVMQMSWRTDSVYTHISDPRGLKASMLFGKDWRVGGFAQLSAMYALARHQIRPDVAQALAFQDEFLSFFQTYAGSGSWA
jgi:hypothetical protein